MQITKTQITLGLCPTEVNVLFIGAKYIFYSNFYGLIAVAERDENVFENFSIHIGNKHLKHHKIEVVKAVKRFIKRAENPYVEKKITFSDVSEDLDNASLNVSIS